MRRVPSQSDDRITACRIVPVCPALRRTIGSRTVFHSVIQRCQRICGRITAFRHGARIRRNVFQFSRNRFHYTNTCRYRVSISERRHISRNRNQRSCCRKTAFFYVAHIPCDRKFLKLTAIGIISHSGIRKHRYFPWLGNCRIIRRSCNFIIYVNSDINTDIFFSIGYRALYQKDSRRLKICSVISAPAYRSFLCGAVRIRNRHLLRKRKPCGSQRCIAVPGHPIADDSIRRLLFCLLCSDRHGSPRQSA